VAVKIRLRGLTKQFEVKGRAVIALAGVDLDIEAGEFFCIVGPSGCGKTTLLRILADLEPRTSGEIQVLRGASSGPELNGVATGSARMATGSTRGSRDEQPLNSMVPGAEHLSLDERARQYRIWSEGAWLLQAGSLRGGRAVHS